MLQIQVVCIVRQADTTEGDCTSRLGTFWIEMPGRQIDPSHTAGPGTGPTSKRAALTTATMIATALNWAAGGHHWGLEADEYTAQLHGACGKQAANDEPGIYTRQALQSLCADESGPDLPRPLGGSKLRSPI